MYILKNAVKSITRNKGRNILVGIILLVIATASCIALSIREAAETAKEGTLDNLSITAQISFNRSSAMSDMKEQGEMNMDSLKPEALTLEEYQAYTEALSEGDSSYYTMMTSLNASGELKAYGSEEENTKESAAGEAESQNAFGGTQEMEKRGGMGTQGDFSVTGYSSYEAMISLFGTDGTCTISEGEMFEETDQELTCIISDELAMYNNLSVGDQITLSNPNSEEEIYQLTIIGLYTNASSDEGNGMFAMSEPANDIYMNTEALTVLFEKSEKTGSTTENESGETISASLKNQTNFTYVFSEVDHYYAFEEQVYTLGLSEEYQVSSPDLTAYESSLTPLETLSQMAGGFFLVVLVVGGVILIVLNVFNLRERKYEVGVLTAIGMKKYKVAMQFIVELFLVTFTAIVIGTAVGAMASVPVTNTLLESQVEQSDTSVETVNQNFGFPGGKGEMNGQRPGEIEEVSYVASVSNATNMVVVIQLVGIGIWLTIISSLAALITIMRYEPLQILSSRA